MNRDIRRVQQFRLIEALIHILELTTFYKVSLNSSREKISLNFAEVSGR
jgi:hypothetical protein